MFIHHKIAVSLLVNSIYYSAVVWYILTYEQLDFRKIFRVISRNKIGLGISNSTVQKLKFKKGITFQIV